MPSGDDLHRKSVAELSAAIAAGTLSPRELVDATLARIAAMNDRVYAFVTVCGDEARRDADRLTEELAHGGRRGPLHGIPVAVKDLCDTAGLRTTYGSSLFREHVPTSDAEPVRRLREAGAVLVGKVNTHEFACGVSTSNPHYGATHNPWRHDRIPGGSSGGSAAAVGGGLAPLALGSDTGGSIRIPSALCGCIGLKPTHGRVSLRGTYAMAASCDHVGPIARTARDCALALNAIAGFDRDDPWSRRFPEEDFTRDLERPLRGRRIAIAPDFRAAPLAPAVEATVARARDALAALGAEIVPVALPAVEDVFVAANLIWVETYGHHARQFAAHADAYGADVRALIEYAKSFDTATLVHAQHVRERLSQELSVLLTERVDALLLPTTALEAPLIGADHVDVGGQMMPVTLVLAAYTLLFNLTRLPAVAVPAGLGDADLPTSVQIATAAGAEALALNVAHQLEQSLWPVEQRWRDLDRARNRAA